jgi:hypothetical protein
MGGRGAATTAPRGSGIAPTRVGPSGMVYPARLTEHYRSTGLSAKVANRLAGFARTYGDAPYETGGIILPDGTRHLVSQQNPGEVQISSLIDKLVPGSVFTHNHPSGGSFSVADLQVFGAFQEMKEFHATSRFQYKGTPGTMHYKLIRTGEPLDHNELRRAQRDVESVTRTTHARFHIAIARTGHTYDELSKDERATIWSDVTHQNRATQLSSVRGLRYERVFVPD